MNYVSTYLISRTVAFICTVLRFIAIRTFVLFGQFHILNDS